MGDKDEDDIPTLEDVLRPGDGARRRDEADKPPAGGTSGETQWLSDAEIEAIASRVVERHTERMQEAVARAIRKAIDLKKRQQEDNGNGST